jgi:hypothetical protein
MADIQDGATDGATDGSAAGTTTGSATAIRVAWHRASDLHIVRKSVRFEKNLPLPAVATV